MPSARTVVVDGLWLPSPNEYLREHRKVRAARIKHSRSTVGWILIGKLGRGALPTAPTVVTITRIAPSDGLDEHDNLPGSCKLVVDEIAAWMHLPSDRHELVTWSYAQERGPYAARITIEAKKDGA